MDLGRCVVGVTGAGGFIGSHLAGRLVGEAARVRALVRYNSRNDRGHLGSLPAARGREVEVMAGDITDAGRVGRFAGGCDVVFHLAALVGIPYSYHAPESYVAVNVVGTHNVLRACLEAGVAKVVHTSTSEVYGTARHVPMDENHPLQGQSPYSATKIAADKLAESYFLSFGLPVTTVRPFNAYGPRQSARAVVPAIIGQLLSGPTVRLGALDPVRDFTYVDDTVDAFIAAARADGLAGEVINVGSGAGISVGDLAAEIARLMGRKRVRVVTEEGRKRPAASEVRRLVCDNRKAKRLLGWEPRTPLPRGLARTIGYYETNRALYAGNGYVI